MHWYEAGFLLRLQLRGIDYRSLYRIRNYYERLNTIIRVTFNASSHHQPQPIVHYTCILHDYFLCFVKTEYDQDILIWSIFY